MLEASQLEERFLGGVLLFPDAGHRFETYLSLTDFTTSKNQHLWNTYQDIFACGGEILAPEIAKRARISVQEIGHLMDEACSENELEWYAKEIRQNAAKDRFRKRANTVLQTSSDPAPLIPLIEAIQHGNGLERQSLKEQSELVKDLELSIQKCSSGQPLGVLTGYDDLDKQFRGFRPGDVYIICGETANGKSALALWMARRIVARGQTAMFVSIEMPAIQIQTRLMASMTGLSYEQVEKSLLVPDHSSLVRSAAARLETYRLPIYDAAGLTVSKLARDVHLYKQRHGLDVLFVDYLQLLDGRNAMREQEVAGISRGLKRIAKSESIPVIACAQLRRAIHGESKQPTLNRLRDSGQIEQDASGVLGVYWGHRYDPGLAWDDLLVTVLKNRNGAMEDFHLKADWRSGRFESREEEDYGQDI